MWLIKWEAKWEGYSGEGGGEDEEGGKREERRSLILEV